MRRIMMTIGGTVVVLGSSLIAAGQDKAPAQAPAQAPAKAPMQAPAQAPAKAPAPVQAPTQKIAPVQAPTQAPTQKMTQAPTQSPVQKGGKQMAIDNTVPDDQQLAMARPGLFRRFR
jgi:hypothetical protein